MYENMKSLYGGKLERVKTGLCRPAVIALFILFVFPIINAQTPPPSPTILAPNLQVRTTVSGLNQPISMAFLGSNDILVLEKASGNVKRVVNGSVQSTVLDLAVNSASERGLLGIALHPNFPVNPGVYLYWTCSAPPPPAANPFFPTQTECPDTPATGADTNNVLAVPLLGNRVDRFIWNGTTLVFDRNIVKLRVFQHDGAPDPPGQGDSAQNPAGNHDGGVIRFGPDGKLYIIIGDTGRRGQTQNLPSGPTLTGLGTPVPDDQFGGPQPDNAHLTGVILRLNDDGSTPMDNPFFGAGSTIGGAVGANIQKIFAYGIRNGFGMAFDPESGTLWTQEHGDDSFDELNAVAPGFNSGWIQFMGPASRIAQFKAIETSPPPLFGLQQLRWAPTRLADTPEEAFARLFMLPGAAYSDPEFSWKFAVAPGGIGFMSGRGIGPQYEGDLFVGASRLTLENGYLFHFNLTGNRRKIGVDDPRLEDRVADNAFKFDITESEEFLIGRNFGVSTDIQTGPNGNLYVVSLSSGAIYEIFSRKPPKAHG
ncbi:MAG TPA: PQQ-dependent sugar dehydrogenase, partial [Pyrinomonadaceae bacterium]